MSKYTDILVRTDTKERLQKFANSKGLNIGELLEHICNMLDKVSKESPAKMSQLDEEGN